MLIAACKKNFLRIAQTLVLAGAEVDLNKSPEGLIEAKVINEVVSLNSAMASRKLGDFTDHSMYLNFKF